MPVRTSDTDDRLPTSGPETHRYERYSHVRTADCDIIYDTTAESALIAADDSLSLDEWQ